MLSKIILYPVDYALLRQVAKSHAFVFLCLLFMGAAFCAFGLVFWFYMHTSSYDYFIGHVFGGIFFSIGAAILAFNFISNFSSFSHYYTQGLLKKHGFEVQATITDKRQKDESVRIRVEDAPDEWTEERELLIQFEYENNGVKLASEAILSKQAIFDGLAIGDKIPVMILPQKPNITAPRMKKIADLVKRKGLNITEKANPDIEVGENLMDVDV